MSHPLHCCDRMNEMLCEHEMHRTEEQVFIYGRPSFANDGDGHFDNMTDSFIITYCPFCGRKIDAHSSKGREEGCQEAAPDNPEVRAGI